MTKQSSDSINAGKKDIQAHLEKQDTQFRALTKTLKDPLNNLSSVLGNFVSKLFKSIDEKINKLNSVYNSEQTENPYRERKKTGTPSSDSNGKRRVGPAKLPGNTKKRRIYQEDESLSLFAPSHVENDLQQQQDSDDD